LYVPPHDRKVSADWFVPGDLSRYFGGSVLLPSIAAHTVEHDDLPGHLSAKRFDEDLIPEENRIPRLTSASWKYESGAVGSLMHAIALHGAIDICRLSDCSDYLTNA
jgi:hypothetical protein